MDGANTFSCLAEARSSKAANVADLLDLLLVHEYPQDGSESEAISLVREFATQGKPVVLGETAPLLATTDTWRSFVTGARDLVDGYLFFYDGRTARQAGTSAADAWYAAALDQFVELRGSLAGARLGSPGPAAWR